MNAHRRIAIPCATAAEWLKRNTATKCPPGYALGLSPLEIDSGMVAQTQTWIERAKRQMANEVEAVRQKTLAFSEKIPEIGNMYKGASDKQNFVTRTASHATKPLQHGGVIDASRVQPVVNPPYSASKNRAAWARGMHRRENGRHTAPPPPAVALTWSRISGPDLDLVRIELGLTESEMATILGLNVPAYRGWRSGEGMLTGPVVKLIALVRSLRLDEREKVTSFLLSQEAPAPSLFGRVSDAAA